ncbi:hypothetical protein DWB67_15065 [Paracoccus sp. JM45]|nr:hypothetical protein DWB67_15065 [Paracoccus sp. JM45]
MGWLLRSLAGPVLWAVLFSAVYALHGIGCAGGWQNRPFFWTDLQHAVLAGLWLTGIIAHLILVRYLPSGDGIKQFLIIAGTVIGLVSSAITLFPVVIISSCLSL